MTRIRRRTSISAAGAVLIASVAISAHAQAEPTPAERLMASARETISNAPDKPEGHITLGLALTRRARETSDTSYYHQALEAIDTALRLAPDNREAEKVRVWALLGQHEFKQALEQATRLNKQAPDDVLVYGFIVDASVELGHYEEAEAAAQWMLDLRPGNIPALTRTAYLRELFGDIDGAVELMNAAFTRTPSREREDRAWILTQLAHLQRTTGRLPEAETLLQQALSLFPDYHYALGELARVRIAQGRAADATGLLERQFAAAPHAENLFYLAEAMALAGRREEAGQQFARFERLALAESARVDNANRELVAYYVDHAGRPVDALSIAEREYAARQDVHTLDMYAWALLANGRVAEARRMMDRALLVGIRDPKLWYHAAVIAEAQQDHVTAMRHLDALLAQAPQSDVSAASRALLERIRSLVTAAR